MKPEHRVNRRELILGAIALVGGSPALLSCSDEPLDVDLHAGERRFFDETLMRVLSRVVDVTIPRTDTPGALAAGVDVFIDGMMADWAAPDTRRRYADTLRAIDERASAEFGTTLTGLDETDQERLIRDVDREAFGDAPAIPGFRELKTLIVTGYYSSEIGAGVELQFELVPARYLPCASLADIGRAWAYR